MASENEYAKAPIRYAKSGEVHVAYRVFGQGSTDLVVFPGFISHLDLWWEEPILARWLAQLAESMRVIMFDKRGTGLSDRVGRQPGMDERMDDARAVMDAAGVERAAIFGISEGGSFASLFAATHPGRCQALVLYGAFARFSSWFPSPEVLQQFFSYVDKAWGSGASLRRFAPSVAGQKHFQDWWGRFERLGASPAGCIEIMRMNGEIDITDILPSVHVPTLIIHRTDDMTVNVAGGRELAKHIPDARYVELPGNDHLFYIGDNAGEILDLIVEFLTGSKSVPVLDRVLATVLFTDIVDFDGARRGARRCGLAYAAHRARRRGAPRACALPRPRSEDIGRRLSRDLRRPGARHSLRARDRRRGARGRRARARRRAYRRGRACRKRRARHRRAYRRARGRSRQGRRRHRVAHGEGSGGGLGADLRGFRQRTP